MLFSLICKLVLRNWWRNKIFCVISILSLAIGIACANLLTAFVIHEYNIENNNPNKNEIFQVFQDFPMRPGEKVPYVYGKNTDMMKQQFPEIRETLVLGSNNSLNCRWENNLLENINHTYVKGPFFTFFPYETLLGNPEQILEKPGQAILSESFAKKLFGKENPLNQLLVIYTLEGGEFTLQVGAVVKDRTQSLMEFDILSYEDLGGGSTFLLTIPGTDKDELEKKIEENKIPTLQGDIGNYYLFNMRESYFQEPHVQQSTSFLKTRQLNIVRTGAVSALVILFIACFNYVNLSFSRILQQVKLIHTEKLMGANQQMIRQHLFTDSFLTVLIAFLISFLLVHDFLPYFNSILGSSLTSSFFFSNQVLYYIPTFVLLLIILPAIYMSRKLSRLSGNDYRLFFTGGNKRKVVSFLVMLQFTFSIGLVICFLTVNNQLRLTRHEAKNYVNLFGIYSMESTSLTPFKNEVLKLPSVLNASTSFSFVVSAGLFFAESTVNGIKVSTPIMHLGGDDEMLETLRLELIEGLPMQEAVERYKSVCYLNQTYLNKLIPPGEDPVGKPLSLFSKELFPEDSTLHNSRHYKGFSCQFAG